MRRAPLLAERQNDPRLAYANALLKQATGDNDGALALFDAVTNTRSMLDHARAAVSAVELRLTMGKLDAKAAADGAGRRASMPGEAMGATSRSGCGSPACASSRGIGAGCSPCCAARRPISPRGPRRSTGG